MASKKKVRPLFEVPAEIESEAQSGWVYRSGSDTSPKVYASTLSEMSADTVALAVAAMMRATVLGIAIATLPWAMGLRTLQSVARRDVSH